MRKNVLMSSGLNKEMSNHLITFLPYQEEGHSVRERERTMNRRSEQRFLFFIHTSLKSPFLEIYFVSFNKSTIVSA